jgi:hypothetical protein
LESVVVVIVRSEKLRGVAHAILADPALKHQQWQHCNVSASQRCVMASPSKR